MEKKPRQKASFCSYFHLKTVLLYVKRKGDVRTFGGYMEVNLKVLPKHKGSVPVWEGIICTRYFCVPL